VKKLCFVVAGLLALSACSSHYSSNGETVYLQSRNGDKLEVPAPLGNANVSYFYDLPPQNQDAHVSIAPPMVNIK
jgi:uncharacterized lipoprotein